MDLKVEVVEINVSKNNAMIMEERLSIGRSKLKYFGFYIDRHLTWPTCVQKASARHRQRGQLSCLSGGCARDRDSRVTVRVEVPWRGAILPIMVTNSYDWH